MENITFLISNKCNFRCNHCFINAGSEIENELSSIEKYKVIDRIHEFGGKKIVFSGGEPLLKKEIFNYIKYAKNKGLKVGLLTNGWILDKKKIEILENEVDSLSISLYTNDILKMNIETYKNYLEKMIEILKELTNSKINYKITLPVSKKNIKEIYNFLEEFIDKNIKPKICRIYVITPIGRAKQNEEICTEKMDFSKIIKNLPKKVKESKLNIGIEQSSIDINNCNSNYFGNCQIIKFKNKLLNNYADPHIDANGDIYLCGLLLRNKKYVIGNILNNSKEEIERNAKEIAMMIEKNTKEDFCPALNRKVERKKKLVCPIVYIDQKYI